MVIKVTCLLKVDNEYHSAVCANLTGLGITVVPTKPAESTGAGNSHDRDAVACEKSFNDKDIASALALSSTLEEVPGVQSAVTVFTSVEDPKTQQHLKWHQKPILTVIISSAITAITVSYAVYHLIDILDPTHQVVVSPWDIMAIITAPTAINFLFQAQRFFSREHM